MDLICHGYFEHLLLFVETWTKKIIKYICFSAKFLFPEERKKDLNNKKSSRAKRFFLDEIDLFSVKFS